MELNEAARRIFGTHLRLIAFWVLFGFLAAALLHAGNERTYTATTRLVLDTPDAKDRSDSTAIADMAKAIATSPSEVRGALGDAHITTRDPVDVARHHVSVTALGSSAVLDLSVSDPNRRVAAAVSNTLAARVIQTRLKVSSGQLQQVLNDLDGQIATLNRRIGGLDAQIASLGLTNASARDAAQRERDILVQARGVLEAERVSLSCDRCPATQPGDHQSGPTADACGFFSFVAGPGSWCAPGPGSRDRLGGSDRNGSADLRRRRCACAGVRHSASRVALMVSRARDSASGWCLSSPRGFTSRRRGSASITSSCSAPGQTWNFGDSPNSWKRYPPRLSMRFPTTRSSCRRQRPTRRAVHSLRRRSAPLAEDQPRGGAIAGDRARFGHAHNGVRRSHFFGRWAEWGRYRPGLAE